MKHVSLPTLLQAAHAAEMENAHTAMPAKVVSYDSTTMCVAAQPLVKRPGQGEDGTTKYEEIPTYPQVPVAFPRAGDFVLYMPITKGCYGTLVFFDMSPAEALSSGQVSEPQDVSRHAGGYCFFIPGVYPINQSLSDQPSNPYFGVDGDEAQVHTKPGEIRLGKTATDFVALASLVLDRLNAIVNAFNVHVHATAGTGPPVPPTPVPLVIPIATPSSVAASITKAK